MLTIFNYQVSLNINPYLLIIIVPLVVLLVWYIYKYTIPQTTKWKKSLLIISRTLALILLIILIFDPKITKIERNEQKAVTQVFFDVSSSIFDKADTTRIVDLISELGEENNFELYTFGEKVSQINDQNKESIKFHSPITNFENVFNHLKKSDEFISSAVIISDGIINDGSGSIYQSENINFPIYTVGVGDTSSIMDVYVSSIISNRYLYKDSETLIAAEISNKNLSGETATVTLLENNKILESKSIELSESGINRVLFNYKPKNAGRQKISVRVNNIKSKEDNTENNVRSKFVDVLENKLNILVVSGAPSADVSAIIETLNEFEEYQVNKFIEINSNKNFGASLTSKLDSAQILVMINFPLQTTKKEFVQEVKEKIAANSLPTFYLTGINFDQQKINPLSDFLPFSPTRSFDEIYLAQPKFQSTSTGIFSVNNGGDFNSSDLPPIFYPNRNYQTKPGSNVLATANVNNVETQLPLIVSDNSAGIRNISVLAGNIWRWRISSNESTRDFFKNFIRNSIQWLRVSADERKFFVETNKDVYAKGETIYFTSELYDEKLSAIDNAIISLSLKSDKDNYNLELTNVGDGIYQGSLVFPESGDINFSAKAEKDGVILEKTSGKFNIGEVDLEKLQTVMQDNYLKQISSNTGGEFIYLDNAKNLFKKIGNANKDKIKVETSSFSFDLLSMDTLLIAIIIIFSFEWFLRKREGML